MTTVATLKAALESRLGNTTSWSSSELEGYVKTAIEGLYPSFYRNRVATTIAADGPIQTAPVGARNFYRIGLQRLGSTRVRKIRGWAEGDGEIFCPKTGVTGQTLVWSWTEGWEAPASTTDAIGLPPEAREVVVLRAHISALEKLLSNRLALESYLAIQVREGTTDEEIVSTLDALHLSVRERLDRVRPLPELQQ